MKLERSTSSFGPPASFRDRIVGIDRLVPLLDGTSRRYVNLDNAASTPALREVSETVNRFLEWYSSVYRGAGFKSSIATHAYEEARRIVGDFVGASPRDHVVIFGKNATEGINKLSYRMPLGPDDVVLVSTLEHHSNDLPWRGKARVARIGADSQGRLDEAHLDQLLLTHAGRVRLVAVTGASNVTGHMPDIHGIAARTHAAGAQILVDCAQLAPHRAIDMRPLDDPRHLDYVVLSAHKMYAPFGTGALVGRRDTFERGVPEYTGGGTVAFVSPDEIAWAATPDRDEAGSPNVIGAVALAAAVEALQGVGMDAIARHEAELTARAFERLSEIDGLRIYGDVGLRRLGVITFNLEPFPHSLVAAILSAEYGIGVRNGCFCAHPYLVQLLGVADADVRLLRGRLKAGDRGAIPGMVRVSFGGYNTLEEVDMLADALWSIARGKHKGDYVLERSTGEYAPFGWSPDPSAHFTIGHVSRAARIPALA